MVKLRQFHISNYRSCLNTKVEVHEYLTTLIGVNGVGKSNILNSLRLLKKVRKNRYLEQNILKESLSESKLRLKIELEGRVYMIKADIFYDTDENNSDEIYSSDIFYKLEGATKWVELDRDLVDAVRRFGIQRLKTSPEIFHRKNKKINEEEINISLAIAEYIARITYYSATQFSDPSKCPVSIELEDSRPAFRSYRSDWQHEKFLYDLYSKWSDKKGDFQRYLNTVNKNGIGLINDIDFLVQKLPSSSYEVLSGGRIRKIDKSKNIVIPSITIDSLSLSPNQLSEGTFKTLALVFYILNDTSDLLLIEEPEVCVHHGLLSSIIELIKERAKTKQVIVSTHSDYVLDQLKPENILLISRAPETGTVAKPLTKTLSKNDFGALKEYLSNSGNLGEYWKEGGFEND